MAVNYVKFIRGSSLAFSKLTDKNSDTLYFITDSDSNKSSLYLGDKLITGNISKLTDLKGIELTNPEDGQLLTYNEEQGVWANKSIIDAIGVMVGASATAQGGAGLVPAPGIEQQELFLRGDGTWAQPTPVETLDVDGKTITTIEGKALSLKDFGYKYYRYIPAQGSIQDGNFIEAHYEAQTVNSTHPWIEGLIPKVVNENGSLVLGWFEEKPFDYQRVEVLETKVGNIEAQLNDIDSKIEDIETKVDETEAQIQTNKIDISNINTSIVSLADLLNSKANSEEVYKKDEVYTKSEVDIKILQAGRLERKTFDSLEEANEFILTVDNPEQYVYMVPAPDGGEGYDEYLYIDNKLEFIGTWDVSLEDYVTKDELKNLENIVIEQSTKIEGIQTSVVDLSALLNKLDENVETINSSLGKIDTSITSISDRLNGIDAKNETFEESLNSINSSVNDITNELDGIKELINGKVDQEVYDIKIDEIENNLSELRQTVSWTTLTTNK